MIYYDPKKYNLTVTAISGDEALCICPFHNDKHQSAEFNIRTGLFHCFGCSVSYNIEQLAEKMGVDIEEDLQKPKFDVPESDATDWQSFLNFPLAYDHPYLIKRRVDNTQVEKHRILNTGRGVGFVLRNEYGVPCGFQERLSNHRNLRYLNYGKPHPYPFYNLGNIHANRIYIVEGIFGVLNAEKYNIPALACLSASNARRFWQYFERLENAVVFFDNDKAGYINASALVRLSRGKAAMILPGGEADELSANQWEEMKYRKLHRNWKAVLDFLTNEEDKRMIYNDSDRRIRERK